MTITVQNPRKILKVVFWYFDVVLLKRSGVLLYLDKVKEL